MKTIKPAKNKKRKYTKPSIEKIKLDNEITIFMSSPPSDPDAYFQQDNYNMNPFKLPNL